MGTERDNLKIIILLIVGFSILAFAFWYSSLPENYQSGTLNNFCKHYNMETEHLCNSIGGCCIKVEGDEIITRKEVSKVNGKFVFETS